MDKFIDVVIALHRYQSEEAKCLSFNKGEILWVLSQDKSGWWNGICNGKKGWFPSNFVKSVKKDIEEGRMEQPPIPKIPSSSSSNALTSQTNNKPTAFANSPASTSSPSQSPGTADSLRNKYHKNNDSLQHSSSVESLNTTDSSTPPPVRQAQPERSAVPGPRQQSAGLGATVRATPNSTPTASSTIPAIVRARSESTLRRAPSPVVPLTSTNSPGDHTFERSVSKASINSDVGPEQIEPTAPRTLETNRREGAVGPSTKLEAKLPENWRSKKTPDGVTYYYNIVTNKTTYKLDEVLDETQLTVNTDREQTDMLNVSGSSDGLAAITTPRSRRPSITGWVQTEEKNHLTGAIPTWDILINNILRAISKLNESAKKDQKSNYPSNVEEVVKSIKDMIMSSGTVSKDSVLLRHNRVLKSHHHNIMTSLSKLVLAAKVASGIWPPPDSAARLRFQAGQLLLAIRHFVSVAQEAGVELMPIRPSSVEIDIREFDTKGSQLSDMEFIARLDQYEESIIASLNRLRGQVRKEQNANAEFIELTKATVTEIGQMLSLVEDLKVSGSQTEEIKDASEEFQNSRVSLFNTTMNLLTVATQAMNPFAPASTSAEVKTTLTSLITLVDSMIMATKILIDQINSLDERDLQDEVLLLDEASKRDSDLLMLQRRAMSLTFVDKDAPSVLTGTIYRASSDDRLLDTTPEQPATQPELLTPPLEFRRKTSSAGDLPSLVNSSTSGSPPLPKAAATPSIPYRKESSHEPSSRSTSTTRVAKWFGSETNENSRLANISEHPGGTSQSSDNKWFLNTDIPPKDIMHNQEGLLLGATFPVLIEQLTIHNATPDPIFISNFLMTFHLFASSEKLLDGLEKRYFIAPPRGLTPDEHKIWIDRKQTPIRLRVFNVIRFWIENHWIEELDDPILKKMTLFSDRVLETNPGIGERLQELIAKKMSSNPRAREVNRSIRQQNQAVSNDLPDCPSPILPRAMSMNMSILDLDPLEVARQLTIIDSRIFCAIWPKELLGQEWTKKDTKALNVKKMSTYSTKLTEWVVQCILSDPDAKKRTIYLKQFIKIADKARSLNNFNTLMALIAGLQTSTITRLKKTWEGLSSKHKNILDSLLKITDHSRNFAVYRTALKASPLPCLPFLGIHLTDLVFTDDGNPSTRAEGRLINFDKYARTAKIITDLQHFQVPYSLIEVKEIQSWLRLQIEGLKQKSVEELYRQSLILEPRENGGLRNSYEGIDEL